MGGCGIKHYLNLHYFISYSHKEGHNPISIRIFIIFEYLVRLWLMSFLFFYRFWISSHPCSGKMVATRITSVRASRVSWVRQCTVEAVFATRNMAETVRSLFDYREPPTLDSDGEGSKPPPPRGWGDRHIGLRTWLCVLVFHSMWESVRACHQKCGHRLLTKCFYCLISKYLGTCKVSVLWQRISGT